MLRRTLLTIAMVVATGIGTAMAIPNQARVPGTFAFYEKDEA